jgi:hypothetical protein
MRAQLLPPRSPEATGMIASLGKTQTPALAATSRRSLSYTEGTFTCRDFLASYARATEAWLQGEACRTDHGKWEVKSLSVKRSRDSPETP